MSIPSGFTPVQPILTDIIGTHHLPVSGAEGKGPTRRGFLISFTLDSSQIPRRPGGRFEWSSPPGSFTGKTGCAVADPVILAQVGDFRFSALFLLPSPALSGT